MKEGKKEDGRRGRGRKGIERKGEKGEIQGSVWDSKIKKKNVYILSNDEMRNECWIELVNERMLNRMSEWTNKWK